MLNKKYLDEFANVAVELGELSYRYAFAKDVLKRQKSYVTSLEGWALEAAKVRAPSQGMKIMRSQRSAARKRLKESESDCGMLRRQVSFLEKKIGAMKIDLLTQ